jgi:hypothetical protein
MHMVRSLDTRLGPNIFMPCFRTVNFDDEGNIVTVSTHLRHAWTAISSEEDESTGAVGKFLKKISGMDADERTKVPQNEDLTTIHTTWRDSIYTLWNHVFYDVMNFLSEAAMGVGHFHPPSQDIFAVGFPEGDNVAPMSKTWDTNVLLIHSYLAPGVHIRLSTKSQKDGDDSEVTLGTFDGTNQKEIWYVSKGTNVNVHVEGEFAKGMKGHAAVIVFGICCLEDSCSEGL